MYLTIILYLVGFVRTLLVIVVIYFAIRLVSRYILPRLVQKGMKNMQQKMQDQYRQQQNPSRPEGDVTIEKNKSDKDNKSHSNGDYVDFEEVE